MSVAALVNGDGGLASMPGLQGLSVMSQATISYTQQLRGYAASFASSAPVDQRLIDELGTGTSMYAIQKDPKLTDQFFMQQLGSLECIPECSPVPFDLFDNSKAWDCGIDWAYGSVKVVKCSSVANHTTDYYIVVRAGVPSSVLEEFRGRVGSLRYCDLLTNAEYNRVLVCSELNRDRIAAAVCSALDVETAGRTVRELKDERVATPVLNNSSCIFEGGEDSSTVLYYNNCANTASADSGVMCEHGAHAERWFQGSVATRVKDGGGSWENGILNACPTTCGQKPPSEHPVAFKGVSNVERDSIRRRFIWEGVCPLTHACVASISHGCSPQFTSFMTSPNYVRWDMAWGFKDLETLISKVSRVLPDNVLSMAQLLSMYGDEVRGHQHTTCRNNGVLQDSNLILPLANYDALRFALTKITMPLHRHQMFGTLSRDATTVTVPLALLRN